MRLSKAFIPTLKEIPAEAETKSHKLMLRAGLIRQLFAGVYSFLPLGWRSMLKTIRIVREEMDRIGGQEILMPALTPLELWDETKRSADMGAMLLRIKDRKKRDIVLAPTHEEIISAIARGEIRSYKELPQIWYQIQSKFRDEPRPRSGLLRVREFIMKDSYTLAANEKQLDESYNLHADAYKRIFDRCGLKYNIVGASSGLMGGTGSQEFMVPVDAGEDQIVLCDKCGYAANIEVAEGKPHSFKPIEMPQKEKVHTPELKTVKEVSEFIGAPAAQMVKSLLYIAEKSGPVLFLLRGDDQLSEEKAQQAMGEPIRPATDEEIEKHCRTEAGFIGPIGVPRLRKVADTAIDPKIHFATGANQEDYHIRGYRLRDVGKFETADIRQVKDGDTCPHCGAKLHINPAVEIGHIFKLGTKYSSAMGATFIDEQGKKKPIIMGSYGIGIGRILSAAIELYADDKGIVLPISIAPYEIIITVLGNDRPELMELGERLYGELRDKGIDTMLDDRDTTAGVKFADADLLGIPIRLTVGGKSFDKGNIEIYDRRKRKSHAIKIEKALSETIKYREKLFAELMK